MYRDDLTLMYFARVDPSTGKLAQLRMTPMQIKHFRLNRASRTDTEWLTEVLNREGEFFGTQVLLEEDGSLALQWDEKESQKESKDREKERILRDCLHDGGGPASSLPKSSPAMNGIV